MTYPSFIGSPGQPLSDIPALGARKAAALPAGPHIPIIDPVLGAREAAALPVGPHIANIDPALGAREAAALPAGPHLSDSQANNNCVFIINWIRGMTICKEIYEKLKIIV